MKRTEELSQRDNQKLTGVKKLIGCSPEYRAKLITTILKNVLLNAKTDDDEQKAYLLLEKKAYYAPQCASGYKALCETIAKTPTAFDASVVSKARAFAKAHGFNEK